MIKVALVRGRYLNNFEGQNYVFDRKKIQLTAFSSLKPLNNRFLFPVIRLFSPSDLQNISFLDKPVKFLMNRFIGDSQILFGLKKYAGQFDVFHTADCHYYYSYQLARFRKKSLIKKLIATSWETIPFNNESTRIKKYIKKFTQKHIDLFICHTQKAKNCLIKEGVDKDKIKIIKLGVDLNKFKPQSSIQIKSGSKYKIITQNLKILFVGRPVEEKGINDLKEVVKDLKNVSLNIVEFGTTSYQKMPKIYQEADMLVLPSKKTKTWEEQYGMVLIEAMASGLPIIAYDTGAIKEVVGNVGILVKENYQELSNAVKYLTENKTERKKLAKISRRRAERCFDSIKTAQKIQKIYENINSNH